MFDDAGEVGSTAHQIGRGHLTLEYGVLQVVAVIPHRLEDLLQPLVVADVVADEVGCTHGLENSLCRAEIAIPEIGKPSGSEYLSNATTTQRGPVRFLDLLQSNQGRDSAE